VEGIVWQPPRVCRRFENRRERGLCPAVDPRAGEPGGRGFEKSDTGMPSYEGVISDAQIEALVLYIKSLR
jgi:hypothetical protein